MSVIVAGMDMPETCSECELRYLDTGDDAYFGSNEERCVIDGSRIEEKEIAYDCPLKSVEGLLNQIENTMALRCKDNVGNVFILEKDLFKIIIEYCGMEE